MSDRHSSFWGRNDYPMGPLFAVKRDQPSVLDLISLLRCSDVILPGSIRLNVHVLLSVKRAAGKGHRQLKQLSFLRGPQEEKSDWLRAENLVRWVVSTAAWIRKCVIGCINAPFSLPCVTSTASWTETCRLAGLWMDVKHLSVLWSDLSQISTLMIAFVICFYVGYGVVCLFHSRTSECVTCMWFWWWWIWSCFMGDSCLEGSTSNQRDIAHRTRASQRYQGDEWGSGHNRKSEVKQKDDDREIARRCNVQSMLCSEEEWCCMFKTSESNKSTVLTGNMTPIWLDLAIVQHENHTSGPG